MLDKRPEGVTKKAVLRWLVGHCLRQSLSKRGLVVVSEIPSLLKAHPWDPVEDDDVGVVDVVHAGGVEEHVREEGAAEGWHRNIQPHPSESMAETLERPSVEPLQPRAKPKNA